MGRHVNRNNLQGVRGPLAHISELLQPGLALSPSNVYSMFTPYKGVRDFREKKLENMLYWQWGKFQISEFVFKFIGKRANKLDFHHYIKLNVLFLAYNQYSPTSMPQMSGEPCQNVRLEVYQTGDLRSGAGSDLCWTFFEVSRIGPDRDFQTLPEIETKLSYHRILQLVN